MQWRWQSATATVMLPPRRLTRTERNEAKTSAGFYPEDGAFWSRKCRHAAHGWKRPSPLRSPRRSAICSSKRPKRCSSSLFTMEQRPIGVRRDVDFQIGYRERRRLMS